ncbi:hypothetical protein A3860_16210 [Niastella vici]|uniref:Uncharacterized protein n=1 Tax=Niastella vici TaxID=1703345 RepID=A0A1V9G3J9_9BACT|nr:hypothetical protein [Niastella vici]OQP65215.1 hypothetical protein A3860_16210 [Niastella vici]
MIQTTKRIVTCTLLVCLLNTVHAQDQTATVAPPDQSLPESDTAIATRQALRFADSLVKADFYTEWTTYLNLSCPSAFKFYGGKDGYKENVVMVHYRDEPKTEEKIPKLRLVHLMNDVDTWQCVIEKVRDKWDESRGKVKIYTYLIGESTDNGINWKFIDASHNSIQNIIYILPTVFTTMEIPEGKIVYVDEVAAQEAAGSAVKAGHPAVKKKPVARKPTK